MPTKILCATDGSDHANHAAAFAAKLAKHSVAATPTGIADLPRLKCDYEAGSPPGVDLGHPTEIFLAQASAIGR